MTTEKDAELLVTEAEDNRGRIHRKVTWEEGSPDAETVCYACGMPWPCELIFMLDTVMRTQMIRRKGADRAETTPDS